MPYQGTGKYRHWKGDYYYVVGIGTDEATTETVVIYEPFESFDIVSINRNGVEYRGNKFVRSLEIFDQQVDGKDRFQKIS